MTDLEFLQKLNSRKFYFIYKNIHFKVKSLKILARNNYIALKFRIIGYKNAKSGKGELVFIEKSH